MENNIYLQGFEPLIDQRQTGEEYIELNQNTILESNTSAPNKRKMNALHLAVSKGREDLVLSFLQNGVEMNSVDCLGNTPLHYCGHKEVAIILIEWGADPLLRNNRGDTPLDLIKRRGVESQVISFLTETIRGIEHTTEDASEPLLPKTHVMKRPYVKYVKSILTEFCLEIGLKRFLIVVFIVLLLSLYFAFVITGFAKQRELRIPIVDGEHKVEL